MKNNQTKRRILITGVSGLLGSNLAYCLRDRYDILGLYNKHRILIDGVRVSQCDLFCEQDIKKNLNDFSPEIIVHCAALSNIEFCEKKRDLAYKINVEGTKKVLDNIAGAGIKFIYISTDNLYGESNKEYLDESCFVEPVNYYGETKLLAEQEVLKRGGALILRTNIFGWNIQNKHSLSEWILHNLQNQREFPGFNDVEFSAIYTFDLAPILDKAIAQDLSGIYNLGSRTSVSKYEFAKKIAVILGFNQTLIKSISIDDFELPARRRKHLPLNVSRIESALGCRFPSIEESIEHFCKDYKEGIGKKIKTCFYPQLDIIPYGRQLIDEDDIQAVIDVLKSQNLTQGNKVKEFEESLKSVVGVRYCAAVNSGTSALHLACLAIGVKEGDEIVTSPNSFVASANCIVYCEGMPVFADIDERTYNITAFEIEKRITAKTRAVIVVHFAGQSCEMEDIKKAVSRKEKEFGTRIYIIEDASHALGSVYKGKYVGACQFSDIATLSFHPVKQITTGEGGAVLTNDLELSSKVKFLRSHGITSSEEQFIGDKKVYLDDQGSKRPWYYEQQMLGFNYRITDIQCTLGISQLNKLPFFIKRRREIVEYYNKEFANIEGIQIPFESKNCLSNFHLYVLLIDFQRIGMSRALFMKELLAKKIRTQVHYIPIYRQPYYLEKFGRQDHAYPNEEQYYQRCLSIPLYPAMTMDEVQWVVKSIKEVAACKVN